MAASLLPGMVHAAGCVALNYSGNSTVVGAVDCIDWTKGNITITGFGSLSGTDIGLHAANTTPGSLLTNSGTIVGTLAGLQNDGVLDQVQNNGLIWSTGTGVTVAGIRNTGSGSITSVVNNTGGSIAGARAGIFNEGSIATISNAGMINSNSSSGGTVAAIWNDGGTIGNLTNTGTLQSANIGGVLSGFGVVTENGAIETLTNTGTIAGMVGMLVQGSGRVGALTNSGTISGDIAGIFMEASTAGTITNTGLIVGAPGSAMGGTIGTGINLSRASNVSLLANSGTITGGGAAIQLDSDSRISTITNSGLIAGDVTSSSTMALGISGGRGNVVGTLTGASGGLGVADKGVIKVTGANLFFSGGNLLLNDDIAAAGRSVNNYGATLQINNPITVTGNYSQTGGGLAFNVVDTSSYGYMDVNGSAAISGAAISLAGTGLAFGQSYTVVRPTGSSTYNDNTAFVSVNNGLLARLSNVNGALTVTLLPDPSTHYWDGANTTPDGTIAGGSGTWTANGTNWTSTDGTTNYELDQTYVRPVFSGKAGTVTVDGSQGAIAVNGMQFSTDGYRVTGDDIGLAAASSAVEVDANATAIIDSRLTGTGALAKTGSGMLILNGVNTYSGGTSVSAGTLEIGDAAHPTASILGDVAVGNAGTLRGHGSIGGNVTNDGIVRPGGSIGTLTVLGNYTQSPTGTLFIDVSPTAASQLKVGGTATLAGTLNVLYGPGTYSATSFRIVDAASVTGRFASVTSNAPAELAQSVQSLADGSTLTLAAVVSDGGDPVVIAPTNASIFGAVASAAIREGQRVNDTLLARLGQDCADAATDANCARPGRQAWAQIVSNTANVRGNDEASSYKDRHYGFLAGLDQQVGAWTVGVAGGYSHVDVTEDEATGKIDTLRIAGYGSRRVGAVTIAATVGAAYDFLQTRRSFPGPGKARGDSDGQEITAGLQASLPLAAGPVTITPRLGLRYQYLHTERFSETGSTSQNLDVGAQDFNSLQPYAQLAVGLPFNMKSDKPALVEARVGYAYETLDTNRNYRATASDGTGFTLPGVAPSRGMFSAGLGLTLPVSKALDLTASYDRLFDTGNVSGQTFQLQASYRF
ncbi:autotransporter domain-containing protein [Achromobacter sp. ACM05]|uniref:autotransporter outer membrane beta-barrel domain-containing protein n=1 Tax=Achromobacter sp. ACM05 TaxID=2854776 RepID=UPI001C47613E|nr:autotransporter domain-containing protein [Achromobacter sp. ACM05]